MILKIFKAVWFLSLLFIAAIFLYVYASLPEQIVIHEGEIAITLSREGLFYVSLAFFSFSNVLVFSMSRLYARGYEDFLCWFYGLVICLNIFFIIAVNFINLYNSGEKFDYSRLGVIIYGSLGLVLLWTISWPVYLLWRRFFNKQSV